MALSGDMLRSHRRKKVEPVIEAPTYLYERDFLRQWKSFFVKPPPGLKDTEFMCVFRSERSHHPGFSRDIMKATLAVGENAWQPKLRGGLTEDEEYTKAVRGMLNKLTPDKYDSVTRAFDLTRTYKDDNKIDIMVTAIFDKALSEPTYSQLYVRLCSDIYSLGEETNNVFRKKIIGHAQREFEATMIQRESEEGGHFSKRQNTNIKFVCELVAVRVISTKVIHTIVQTLLAHDDESVPDGPCIEMLSMIMITIGKMLDENPAEQEFLHGILSKVQSLLHTAQYPPRTRFMLMDILDLKERKWVPRLAKSEVPAKVDQDGNPVVPEAHSQQTVAARAAAIHSSQRSKMVGASLKSAGVSFASVVGGNSTSNAMTKASSMSATGVHVNDASGSASMGASSPAAIDPVLLLGEERDIVLSSVGGDPTKIGSIDHSSALLTAQMEYCRSGKREESSLMFINHSIFNTAERLEAFSSCLSLAIVEDILSDVPKFQERWATLITNTFDVNQQAQLIVEAIAQCIQKILFYEEEGKTMEDTFPLADCLEIVWKLILKKMQEHEPTRERTDGLLKGLENVFNVPNIPSSVADALMKPLQDSHKAVFTSCFVQEALSQSGLSVAAQKLKGYLCT